MAPCVSEIDWVLKKSRGGLMWRKLCVKCLSSCVREGQLKVLAGAMLNINLLSLNHAFFSYFFLSPQTFNYSLKHQSLHLYLYPKKWQSDPPLFHHSQFCLRPGKIMKIRPLKMLSKAYPPNHLKHQKATLVKTVRAYRSRQEAER